MKPLPDVDDVQAMTKRGRQSALMSARAEVMTLMRDTFTAMQSADIEALTAYGEEVQAFGRRLTEIAELWKRT